MGSKIDAKTARRLLCALPDAGGHITRPLQPAELPPGGEREAACIVLAALCGMQFWDFMVDVNRGRAVAADTAPETPAPAAQRKSLFFEACPEAGSLAERQALAGTAADDDDGPVVQSYERAHEDMRVENGRLHLQNRELQRSLKTSLEAEYLARRVQTATRDRALAIQAAASSLVAELRETRAIAGNAIDRERLLLESLFEEAPSTTQLFAMLSDNAREQARLYGVDAKIVKADDLVRGERDGRAA